MSIDNSADKLTIRDFDHPYVVEHYDELIASADATLNEGCHLEGDAFIKWLQAHLSGAQLAAMKRRQLGGDATSLLDDIIQVITKPRVARRYLKSRRHIAIFMSRDHAGHVDLMETLVKAYPTLNVLASSPAPNGRIYIVVFAPNTRDARERLEAAAARWAADEGDGTNPLEQLGSSRATRVGVGVLNDPLLALEYDAFEKAIMRTR